MKLKQAWLMTLILVVLLFCIGLPHIEARATQLSNASKGTAREIALNTKVSDKLVLEDVSNWYKFTIPSDGHITIDLDNEETSNTWTWYIELQDWDSNILGEGLKTANYNNEDGLHGLQGGIGLAKGTYYIRIYSYDKDSINQAYNLSVNFTASTQWETERNNTKETADVLTLNTQVYGSNNPVGLSDIDDDWFTFDLPENGSIFINYDSFDQNKFTSKSVSIIDSNGNNISCVGDSSSSTTSGEFILPKGKYFLKLSTETKYGTGAQYRFTAVFIPDRVAWLKDYRLEIDGSDIMLTKYIGDGGDIVIPAKVTINGTTYSVEIGSSRDFEAGLFVSGVFEKSEITTFSSEKGVKVNLAYRMFDDCEKLKTADLSGLDTSEVTSMRCMFNECFALTSIDFTGVKTDKVIDMGIMFCECESLEKLDLRPFNTSNVTNMTGMFWECYKLKDINVSSFDTSKVERMDSMFSCCFELEQLDVSNFDTSKVTTMWGMFFGDRSLKSLDLRNFNTVNVTDMTGVFELCSGLETLNLSGWDMSNAQYTEAFIDECTALKEVITPKKAQSAALPNSMYEKKADNTIGTTEYCSLEEAPANTKLIFVPLETVTVSPKEIQLNAGETATMQVTYAPEKFSRKNKSGFSSSDSTVAKVDENGVITAVSEGTTTISWGVSYPIHDFIFDFDKHKLSTDYSYQPVKDSCTVTVIGGTASTNPYAEYGLDDKYVPEGYTDESGSPMIEAGLDCTWKEVSGKFYWYEGGIKQGTYYDTHGVMGDGTIRGREIYDPASDGWYWLDSVYDGAKAVGKEVWVPYIYQNEDEWDEETKRNIAYESDPGMGELVLQCMREKKGKWVRYDENGRMLKGWVTIEGALAEKYPDQVGNTYYYDSRTGLMAKGEVTIDGQTHYFDETFGNLIW